MLKEQSAYVNTTPSTMVERVNTLVPRANTRWLSSAETDTLATHKPHHCQVPSSDKPEWNTTFVDYTFPHKTGIVSDKNNSVATLAERRYKQNQTKYVNTYTYGQNNRIIATTWSYMQHFPSFVLKSDTISPIISQQRADNWDQRHKFSASGCRSIVQGKAV